MADIVKELEEAYIIHVESIELRQTKEDVSKIENLKHLKVPFKEIYLTNNGFVDSCMIGWGGFGGVYRAELFHVDVRQYVGKKESLVELYGYPRRKGKVALKRREITSDQGRKEFWKEIDVLSELNHQNLVSLVGFCYEYGEMIIIYDYASNGSFEKYIRNVQNLKGEQRLQICIDAAQGLNYLHNHHIIHRDVKSPNILLGDSLEGMIGDVGLSITVKNTDSQLSNITAVGTGGYVDPKYLKRVKTFAAITHECLHSTEIHRLTMADVLKELKNALTVHVIGSKIISLEEVKSATNDFSKKRVIGSGAVVFFVEQVNVK
ncbi:phloem protein 2-like protein [Tanacetum coccineum]